VRVFSVSALVLLALTAFPAAAKPPSPVTPFVVLKDASVSGSDLKTTIDLSFAAPARAKAPQACTGKVHATTKLSRRKRRTFTAALAFVGGRCRASLHGSLPKAFLGKTKSFTLTFAGNTVVKPFTRTKALKLSKPAAVPVVVPVTQPTTTTPPATAPTTPTTPSPGPPATTFFDPAYKGGWGTDPPTSGVNDQWAVAITSSGVVGLSSFGSFSWLCGSMDQLTQANWNAVYQSTGSFTSANHAEDTAMHVSGNNNTSVHWTLDFDGPSLGTGHGTMSASGQYDYGVDGVKACHMTAVFTFYRSGS
jgi:hypothetical protein